MPRPLPSVNNQDSQEQNHKLRYWTNKGLGEVWVYASLQLLFPIEFCWRGRGVAVQPVGSGGEESPSFKNKITGKEELL